MKNDIKYSIIIPVYNSELYIEKCIDSLINQTYKNIEIVIIDDGSTDKTPHICNEYSKKDKRIIYISQNNSGVSTARNKGLDIVTGDYITFIDSDDYIDNNTIENINNIILKEKCDIVKYGYFKEISKFKKIYKFSIKKNCTILNQNYETEIYPYIFSTFDISNVWNAIIKKDIINNIRFDKNLKYGEDFKFMFLSLINSKSIYFYDKPLYHYIYNSNSAINTQDFKTNLMKFSNNVDCCVFIRNNINNIESINDSYLQRLTNSLNYFLTQIAKNNTYKNYVKKIQQLYEDGVFKKIETYLFQKNNKDLINYIQNRKMYKKLLKKEKKSIIIKKMIYVINKVLKHF